VWKSSSDDRLDHATPVIVDIDAFDEILPQVTVVQAAFLFHWQLRVGLDKGVREQPAAVPGNDVALLVVDADAFHAAARRFGLEDVASQVSQVGQGLLNPVLHGLGVVRIPLGGD